MSEGPKNKSETGGSGSGSAWDAQDWPPFGRTPVEGRTREDNPAEGAGAEDTTEDDKRYREWLQKAQERDVNFNPVHDNYDGTGRGATANHFDYHPRVKGEDGQDYSRRSAWERMVREKSEEFPRLRGVNPDGSDETNAQWYKRVGIPSLEDYMNGAEPGDAEADDKESTSWSEMSHDERKKFIKEHPRLPGESTADWGKRVGIGGESGGAESEDELEDEEAADGGDAEEGEGHERERGEMLAILNGKNAREWLRGRYTTADLLNMSDDELAEVVDEYEAYEARRKELLEQLKRRDVQEWLRDVKKLSTADILSMTNEELEDLLAEFDGGDLEEQEEEEEEEDEDEEEDGGEEGEDDKEGPIVAAAIDRTKDAKDQAAQIANKMLEDKLDHAGFFKKIFMGNMFREGFKLRYEREALKQIIAKQNGESTSLDDKDWATKSGLERFVQSYVQGMEEEMIHGKAGEKMNSYTVDEEGKVIRRWVDENGQRHEEEEPADSVNADATRRLRMAIANYAKGGKKDAFEQEIRSINEALAKEGGDKNAVMADNFMAIAETARARYEISNSIDDVMDGFAFVNGEARSNVRTEAHRDALDKITNAISESRIGRYIPPEIIGTAASFATMQGKGAIRTALIAGGTIALGATAAPAIVPIAVGALTAGTFAAIKERNRVTTDRQTQARRLAHGDTEGHTKYDEKMSETQYDTIGAKDVSAAIESAIESGDADQIKKALARANTLTMMSDERGIDLISYSSADTDVIEDERMNLDIARAQAKVALREALGLEPGADVSDELSDAVREATESLENKISAKDKAFRKLRRRRMTAQGFKSGAISAVTAIGTQEIMAMFNPDQVGVLEQAGISFKQNNEGAHNTALGGLLGFKEVRSEHALDGVDQVLTQKEIDARRAAGYDVKPGTPQVTQTETEVPFSEYAEANENATCSNWLGNGTSHSDGNELRGYFTAGRGPHTSLSGESWGGGQTVEMSNLTSQNSGFFATIQGNRMFIPSVSDGNGGFDVDYSQLDSTMADIIRNRSFDSIQYGYINGVDANGNYDFSSIWTFGGSGDYPDAVKTMVETVTPTWTTTGFDKVVERVADSFPTWGLTSRKNLTLGREANAPKPENIGGLPRPEGDGGGSEIIDVYYGTPTRRGESGESGESGGDDPFFDDSWGSRRRPAPAAPRSGGGLPRSGGPRVEAEPAPVTSPEDGADDSAAADGGDSEDDVPTSEGSRAENQHDGFNEVTTVSLTDEQLDAILTSVPEAERDKVRAEFMQKAARWNALPESERIRYMNGYGNDRSITSDCIYLMNYFHVIGSREDIDADIERGMKKLHGEQSEAVADVEHYTMITADSEITKIDIDDADLTKIVGRDHIGHIRRSIDSWNALSEEQRKGFLADEDNNSPNVIGSAGIIMENWGLITSKRFINRRVSGVKAAPMTAHAAHADAEPMAA